MREGRAQRTLRPLKPVEIGLGPPGSLQVPLVIP